MRKDVKTGFAIGGVLLAVLVVYILVISGGEKPQQVSLTTTGDSTTPTQDNAAPATNPAPAMAAAAPASEPSESRPLAAADTTETKTATPPSTAPAEAVATGSGGQGWAEGVLSTGRLPLMVTTTPQASMPAVLQESSTPGSGETSGSMVATASNTPAAVTPIMASNSGPTSRPSRAMQSSAQHTHVVQPNETFASISAAVYGSSAYYPHLIRANASVDPRKLRPGMVINLPDVSDVKADAASAPAAGATASASSIDAKTQYQVQPSDSLYRISMKLYGKPDMIDKIYELNKSSIGPDKQKLKLGMVLNLPEAPAAAAH